MKASPIVIGTMRWGIWGAGHSQKQVQQLIETALTHQLTTFDHADIYGDYTTEKLFGEAFSQMGVARETVQFISKCGIEMPCGNRDYEVKAYNYSRRHIIASVDQSLRNLKTEYLDVLLLHRPSPLLNPHEVAETFEILRQQQKVKHFGVSNFSVSQFNMLDAFFPLITNQIEVSVTETSAFYNGTLDQLMERALRPMAWGVLGNYFTQETLQNKRIAAVLPALCDKYEANENQLLLAFLLRHPSRILPVIGTSRHDKIEELAQSLSLEMEHEDWFRLLQASRGYEVE
ncbi:aldo/keto reductase [Chryseobacterium sp. 6424]|uniref:aldo/keto reductase n=1 Tax=Chryseobacterium sp. 6424 TaxID=2039166 RepID=UPI000EFCF463|nr:aldo/keto reductase [Chryseobacterium sp. 6424]AYO57570.1 aldo/keto reductase [Chryseobacterium sp. 6424]